MPSRRIADALAASLPATPWRTRFAPAPTGSLHLGHVVNAMYVWGIARAYGGRVVLRIEDHDRTRCRPEFEHALLDDLAWLGLDADIGARRSFADHPHPQRQSENHARYASALRHVAARAVVYACRCTRRDIARDAASSSSTEFAYAGTCRHKSVDPASTLSRRVVIPAGAEQFDDVLLGAHQQEPALQCGDLLLRDRNGNWTYQFAVTVDDHDQAIDVIIRGEDLLPSVGRQRMLGRMIGRACPPSVLHHPLLIRPDGTKLSKSHGDTAIAALRERGATPAQLFGEVAVRVGLITAYRPIDVGALPSLFR